MQWYGYVGLRISPAHLQERRRCCVHACTHMSSSSLRKQGPLCEATLYMSAGNEQKDKLFLLCFIIPDLNHMTHDLAVYAHSSKYVYSLCCQLFSCVSLVPAHISTASQIYQKTNFYYNQTVY